MPNPDTVAKYFDRWSKAEAAERANYVLFLSELCDVLGVPRPDPAGADTAQNAYVFERAVPLHHPDGTRRATARTANGRELARFETAARAHRDAYPLPN